MVHQISHVIFDFDGTLVNVIDVIIDVFRDYAKTHGKSLSFEIEKGISNLTSIPFYFGKFIDTLGLNEKEIDKNAIIAELIRLIHSQKFELIPGVERLVKHLHKHNIPMAIATGNTIRHFTVVSNSIGRFFEKGVYFDPIVCGWDDPEVLLKKPNPDVYIVCAKRFETQPKDLQNVLIVEDSLTGITGAVASGMKSLLINDRKYHDFKDISNKITLICDNFDAFKPESLGLPPYDDN